jgi:hypothetical protein
VEVASKLAVVMLITVSEHGERHRRMPRPTPTTMNEQSWRPGIASILRVRAATVKPPSGPRLAIAFPCRAVI